MLVTYAQSSEKYLQGIESLARRARYLARNAGREQPTFQDVATALKEGVVPSDNALAAALAGARPESSRRKPAGTSARAVQPACSLAAQPVQTPRRAGFIPPLRDTGEAVLTP